MYCIAFLDHIACTTYVDAVCCHRPSSVVCRSVGLSHCEPCKNGWIDRDAIWVEDSGWPREPYIRLWSRSPMGMGNSEGKGWPIVKYRDTLRSPVWKWLNRSWCRLDYGLGLAQGIMSYMGSRSRMRKGNFGGKGRPLLSIGTFCSELCRSGWTNRFAICVVDSSRMKKAQVHNFSRIHPVAPMYQKRLNWSICRLSCGLGWAEGSTTSIVFASWRHCAHMGGRIGATWRIELKRPSAVVTYRLMSKYFAHLFWLLLLVFHCYLLLFYNLWSAFCCAGLQLIQLINSIYYSRSRGW